MKLKTVVLDPVLSYFRRLLVGFAITGGFLGVFAALAFIPWALGRLLCQLTNVHIEVVSTWAAGVLFIVFFVFMPILAKSSETPEIDR